MAKARRGQSKASLSQQRAEVRRSAPGRGHVGDAGGADAARRAKGEKLRRIHRAQARASVEKTRRRASELDQPLVAILADIVEDAWRLARTIATAPFRVAGALRTQTPREA